jgi:hypothetical protein
MKCLGNCTEGAPSMVGSIRSFASLVKRENPDVVKTHSLIHREVLVSKTLRDEMKNILDDAIKVVNFMKQRPVHSRMFQNCVKTWTNIT